MNIGAFLKAFGVSLAVFLAFYAFSLLGVPGAAIDSPWKLVALSGAFSIVFGLSWPALRGVKNGDVLVTTIQRSTRDQTGNVWVQQMPLFVTAQQDGRVKQSIRVKLADGKSAVGSITSYAGTFQPATIRLTETELE
ncbi:MAG TPA: hypothetical protein VGQ00_03095 [Candidatus Norongarragalinales archaeon]|jgi:hypothetical protein|nr:hypothetical protein [Candidatus Norongarragalinales archaeon]